MKIVFEAHATSLDNEANLCSGWNDVGLSDKGKKEAAELGGRYDLSELDAIYCPDLQRAINTAQIAFPVIDSGKLFLDWRLRECDYGDMTLLPKHEIEAEKSRRIHLPFPNGESYEQALERVKSFVDDLKKTEHKRVLIIGSRATHYGLDHWINGKSIEDCVREPMIWQPGWTYELQ